MIANAQASPEEPVARQVRREKGSGKPAWSAWSAAKDSQVPATGFDALAGQGAHWNEEFLWRENRQLRHEVESWQAEAAARQRETAELRLEAAQLQAELHAERSRSHQLAAKLEGAPASSSSCFQACDDGGYARGSFDTDWLRAKRLASAAWMDPTLQKGASQSSDLATMATRHAGEVAELQLRHSLALQELQSQADVALGRSRLAEERAARLERSQARLLRALDQHFKARAVALPFALWREAALRSFSAQQKSALLRGASRQAAQAVLSVITKAARLLLQFAFDVWRVSLEVVRTVQGFEVEHQSVLARQARADGALLQLALRCARRRLLGQCVRLWCSLLRGRIAERIARSGKDEQSAWRLELLQHVFREKAKDSHANLVVSCWKAWHQAACLASRERAFDTAQSHVLHLQGRLSDLRLLSVGASVQVQSRFLIRACFASWHHFRCLQQAVDSREELQHLRVTMSKLCYSRNFTIQRMAKRANEGAAGMCLILAWRIWRRLRTEAAVIQELHFQFHAIGCLLGSLNAGLRCSSGASSTATGGMDQAARLAAAAGCGGGARQQPLEADSGA
ncbi:unnamed protein product [Effrenium voratum]|nr:unnamed protein product [Effrenium voratum]